MNLELSSIVNENAHFYSNLNSEIVFQISIHLFAILFILSINLMIKKTTKYFRPNIRSYSLRRIVSIVFLGLYFVIWFFIFSLVLANINYKEFLNTALNIIKQTNVSLVMSKIILFIFALNKQFLGLLSFFRFWAYLILSLSIYAFYKFIYNLEKNESRVSSYLKEIIFNSKA